MRNPVRNDAFARNERAIYHRGEPTDVCAACGMDIWWPEEEVGWDEDGRMCHEKCLELEEDNEP